MCSRFHLLAKNFQSVVNFFLLKIDFTEIRRTLPVVFWFCFCGLDLFNHLFMGLELFMGLDIFIVHGLDRFTSLFSSTNLCIFILHIPVS